MKIYTDAAQLPLVAAVQSLPSLASPGHILAGNTGT
jgi:hypothetical protein